MSFLLKPFSLSLLTGVFCLLININAMAQQYLDTPLNSPTTSSTASDDEASDNLSGSGIIVRQLGNSTMEEYRVSGRTRSVKVTPGGGTSYILIDADGDGEVGASSDSGNDGVTGWQIMKW